MTAHNKNGSRESAIKQQMSFRTENKNKNMKNTHATEQLATVELTQRDWPTAYEKWTQEITVDPKKAPYAMQWVILDVVHERCVDEHIAGNCLASKMNANKEPLLRLIHGLPGSGKTEVMRWLKNTSRTYGRGRAVCTFSSWPL